MQSECLVGKRHTGKLNAAPSFRIESRIRLPMIDVIGPVRSASCAAVSLAGANDTPQASGRRTRIYGEDVLDHHQHPGDLFEMIYGYYYYYYFAALLNRHLA